MISFTESTLEGSEPDPSAGDGVEQSYADLLRVLEVCPLGQEDDGRHLTKSVILGEN